MTAHATFGRLLDCGHRGHVAAGAEDGWCPIDRAMAPVVADHESGPVELGTRIAVRSLRRSRRAGS